MKTGNLRRETSLAGIPSTKSSATSTPLLRLRIPRILRAAPTSGPDTSAPRKLTSPRVSHLGPSNSGQTTSASRTPPWLPSG